MLQRIKRVTMFMANQPPFAAHREVLDRLREKDLINVNAEGRISVFPGAAGEELDRQERSVIYELLGYAVPDENKPLITKRAGVVGGRAAVAGTRIPVWQIAYSDQQGTPHRELRMQTGLSDEQIDQALAYAKEHEEEIERDIFDNVSRFDMELSAGEVPG